jgi:hypothetical protein
MTPQQIEALKLAFEAYCKDERHHTVAETRCWCGQYKLIAQAAIAALAEHAMSEVQRLGQEIEQGPNYKKALEVWLDKTEWVQETVKPHELGMHRADVLKQRIKEALRKPLTDEDLRKLADKHLFYQPESYKVSGVFALVRAIEAAHGIKEKT